jgi:hypothetical protein
LAKVRCSNHIATLNKREREKRVGWTIDLGPPYLRSVELGRHGSSFHRISCKTHSWDHTNEEQKSCYDGDHPFQTLGISIKRKRG